VLQALTYIHSNNQIHRDIKSDNILLTLDGKVKLADFGYAVQLTLERSTRTSIVGTPYWMAPELIRGQKYDAKVDCWSLGIMIREMIDGEPPYMDLPPMKALLCITTEGIPPLVDTEAWTDNFRDFTNSSLQSKPKKRPDSFTLAAHPFLENRSTPDEFAKVVTRAQAIRESQM
jgi:serine/threonine protein kinase